MSDDGPDRALEVAELVSAALERHGAKVALIGAAALAAHGYARSTEDLDLGTVAVPLATLHTVAAELRAAGLHAEVREPDAADHLGGVLRVEVDDMLSVDVVNFVNPLTGAGRRVAEAAFGAPLIPLAGRRLAVVGLEALLLLKLAAGSRFDLRDAAELLALHPELDRHALHTRCAALRLDKKLDRVLADLAEVSEDDPSRA